MEWGEGIMGRDFASLLEELLEESNARERRAQVSAPPSVPFGFLDDSEAPETPVSPDIANAAYLDLQEELLAEIEAPNTDEAAIARELKLEEIRDLRSLDRLRRNFAFANHPDRVKPQWRERAIVRMQIANQMIDDVKHKLRA